MKSRIRVYVLDENDDFRSALCNFVGAAPDLVVAGDTGCWNEARVQIPEIRPQVVLVHPAQAGSADPLPLIELRRLYSRARIVALVSRPLIGARTESWSSAVDRLVYRHMIQTGLLPALREEQVPLSNGYPLYL